MPKRAATNELNHNNWNQEEEPEECTPPKTATPEVMSKRIIKTGKRRITGSTSAALGKSAFSNFTGFGPTGTNTSIGDVKTAFSFLSNSNTSTFTNANGISTQKTDSKDEMEKNNSNKSINSDTDYLSKLKTLNEDVLEWIKVHVGKNPTCILTPVFNEYEKYLKEIQSERHSQESEKSMSIITANTTSMHSSSAKPFFTNSLFSSSTGASKEPSLETKPASSSLIPGLNPLSNQLHLKDSESVFAPPVTSGGLLSDKKSFPLSDCPNTFSSQHVNSNKDEDNEKEDEQPPKNVFEPVTEEGAVFSQRIKLYMKKKESFVENGVGTLYIKPVDKEGTKYQAIVRADTNLGNILLNIILKESLPSKRAGKKDVMIVCIIQVDKEPKSVTVLLRAKNEADADNLLEQINKYKNLNK